MTNAPIVTPAWRLVGLSRSVPGVLTLENDRVRFTTAEGPAFDAAVREVAGIKFPWYYFASGFKATVDGANYRFSFVKPNAGDDVPEELLTDVEAPGRKARTIDALGALAADVQVASLARGRKAGKVWKEALHPR